MDPRERQQEVDKLCLAAFELCPTERQRFLSKLASTDPSLGAEVEQILQADAEAQADAGGFLAPASLNVAALLRAPASVLTSIEEQLAEASESARPQLLRQLLHVEVKSRLQRGETPTVEGYLARFPDDSALVEEVVSDALKVDTIDMSVNAVTSTVITPKPDANASQVEVTMTEKPGDWFPPGDAKASRVKASIAHPSGISSKRGLAVKFGDYELLEEIARGGMGVVYKARQLSVNRIVALKMILVGELASDADVQRFYAEAEAAAKLEHPSIVPVYDAGEVGGQHFFSMGFVDGRSLAARIKDGPLPPREAAQKLKTIAEAVQHAHEHGVIHRDLKPSNVLLDQHDQPRVTDFGLAKQMEGDSGLTASGTIMGTPSYMPPEQADGKIQEIGAHSDVYSLGAILYDLLTARPPFRAATPRETIRQVLEREPAAPRQLNPAVDRDLETICLKCLAKEPKGRYATAAELCDDLGRFLTDVPIKARPVGRAEHLWRWCRRNPLASAFILVVAASILVLISGASMWYRDRLRASEVLLYASLVKNVETYVVSKEPPLGWTWTASEDLKLATSLRQRESDVVKLRNLAAESLSVVDLRLVKELAEGIDAHEVAFSPDSEHLAIGPSRHNAGVLPVSVYSVSNGQQVAQYDVPFATSAWMSLKKVFGSGQTRHQEGIRALAWSPNGKWLVAGGRFGTVYCWDTQQSKPAPLQWSAYTDADVHLLAFSPDGKFLFSLSRGQNIKAWSVDENWKATAWTGGETSVNPQAHDFALTPSGDILAIFTDLVLHSFKRRDQIWFDNGQQIREVGPGFELHPGGRFVASPVRGTTIRLMDLQSGQVHGEFHDNDASGSDANHQILFSRDGSLVLGAAIGRVRIWDFASGRLVVSLPVPGESSPKCSFSPSGRYLAVTAARNTLLYEIRDAEVQKIVAHHSVPVQDVTFAIDSTALVITAEQASDFAAWGSRTTSLSVWDLDSGELREQRRIFSPVANAPFRPSLAAIHPDGRHAGLTSILSGSVIWPLGEGQGPQTPIAVSHSPPASPIVVVEDKGLELVGPSDAIQRMTDTQAADGSAIRMAGGRADCYVAFQPRKLDTKTIGANKTWRAYAVVKVEHGPRYGPAFSLFRFSERHENLKREVGSENVPNDRYHIVQWRDGYSSDEGDETYSFRILPAPNSDAVTAIWVDRVFLVPAHPPGEWPIPFGPIAFSADGTRLWGIVNDEEVVSWKWPDLTVASTWSNAADFVLSGSRLAKCLDAGRNRVVAGTGSGNVVLFDAQTRERLKTSAGPGGEVRSVELPPDESLLALGTERGGLRIMRVYSQPEDDVVADLIGHTDAVQSLAFSQNGLLASGSADRTVRLWQRRGDQFEELVTLRTPSGPVQAIRFGSNGQQLAVLIKNERAVRIWNLHMLNFRLKQFGLDWQ